MVWALSTLLSLIILPHVDHKAYLARGCPQGTHNRVDIISADNLGGIRSRTKQAPLSRNRAMAGAPIINVRPLLDEHSPVDAIDKVVDQIGTACRDWGFFQVVDHGVNADLLTNFNAQAREFFRAPATVKYAIFRQPTNSRGYFDDELTKRKRDWKECFDFGLPGLTSVDGSNQWPDPQVLPGFRPVMIEYFEAMAQLASMLTAAVAQHLGLKPGTFAQALGPNHSSFLRLNYYPPCPDPETNLGISPHNDAGMLTVLLQDDVGGLQVERHGDWIDIQPVEGAYVINVGDMMQVFSNDEIKSPVHRVVAPRTRERLSAPFFYNPAYETVCAPLSGLLQDNRRAKYRPFKWSEFRGKRIAGDISDLGEEVQIQHYRIRDTRTVAVRGALVGRGAQRLGAGSRWAVGRLR